jgi:glyoxylase-like metal-dependent hydrolase (beta-lactamase superfamily II)
MNSEGIERVSDRVYRIKDRFVNLYAIDAGRIALVDTGTRRAGPRIRAGLREIGKEPEDIGFILLTHHHADHMGTAGVWKQTSRANVAVHGVDAPVVAGKERRKAHGIGLRARVLLTVAGPFMRVLAPDPVTPDRTLGDREVLEILGMRVETIFAPGHTLGSCAFHLLPDDVLFSGDAVNARSGVPLPPSYIEDAEAARASFAKLAAMDVKVLAPGHGHPIRRGT